MVAVRAGLSSGGSQRLSKKKKKGNSLEGAYEFNASEFFNRDLFQLSDFSTVSP